MHGPALSGWLLVALCAASGAYCLLRMRAGGAAERGAAGSEAVMGFGMAAMALPAAVLTPPEWSWVLYAGVFGLAALHGLVAAVRHGGHHLHHLVGSLAMVYMALAMAAAPAGAGGHAGHGGAAGASGGIPVLTGVLLAYYGVYVLRSGARLVPVAAATGAARIRTGTTGTAAGELTLVCRLSMGLAMLAMLLAL
ncbi:DUF5134 domain-containing protein [Streptomyces sp. SKN60]|uniref:DUF5134 domain-containing protein n=1 Tax=Streptomyces sp. SKN60 TaxID=2855506 RepID=UPI0022474A01|nr:DUF5134 domain-containing protein [Streptomyces sp. SKN60]MCX2183794.1 DUF5134 domain-containing protein [Streptomyces sp. SKN60]